MFIIWILIFWGETTRKDYFVCLSIVCASILSSNMTAGADAGICMRWVAFHFIKWRVVLQKQVRNHPTYNPVSALEGQKAPRAPITPQSTWYIYIIYVCVYGYVYIYTYKTNHETNYEASNWMYFSYAPCLEWRPPWWAPWWCCWPCPATRRPGSSATTASKRCTSLACKFYILFQKLKWNPFKCLLTWYCMFVFLQDNDKILIYYQAWKVMSNHMQKHNSSYSFCPRFQHSPRNCNGHHPGF